MPYGPTDPVPSYVPAGKQAQFRAVWNSAHAAALKAGKSATDAESTAFAEANGVTQKESAMRVLEWLIPQERTRVVEASLPMNTSHDALRGHLQKALNTAHGTTDSYSSNSPWVSSVFPSHVVYSHGGGMFRRSYVADMGGAGTDPTIKLGDAKPVHAAYVDSKTGEAESLYYPEPATKETKPSVTVTLPEGVEAVTEGVTFAGPVNVKEAAKLSHVPIKIIGPGWGSMAYYSKEMLQRDGPKVYTKGTPMFWNHQTATEEAERPEGNLDNLAAVLTKDAEWKDSGPKGPGLYSEAKVFSDYAQQVNEKGGHIGVSINAAIKGKEGSAEGRTGRIAEQLVRAYSADFVTRAGAGGSPIVPVTEADRGTQERTTMTEQEVKEKADLVAERDSLKTRLAAVETSQNHVLAIATVAATLREAGIPFRQRVLERACVNPVMKEGKPDPEWVKGICKDFAEGVEASVEGFGDHTRELPEGDDAKKTHTRLKEALKSLGVPEKGLDFAVAGRS